MPRPRTAARRGPRRAQRSALDADVVRDAGQNRAGRAEAEERPGCLHRGQVASAAGHRANAGLCDDRAELERARNRLRFSFLEGLSSNSEKAGFIGHYETIANGFEEGLKIRDKIETVTAADIQAVAKRYLDPKNRSVIIGVPNK